MRGKGTIAMLVIFKQNQGRKLLSIFNGNTQRAAIMRVTPRVEIMRVLLSVATFVTTWQNPSKAFKFIMIISTMK